MLLKFIKYFMGGYMRLGGWNLSDTCLSSAQAKARACAPSRTQRIKWVVKYLTLTLRWACRLRVSFAVAGVRYPITGYSSPKTIRVWHSIRRLLGLYPFVGNPGIRPVSQGKKLFSYDKLGFYFTVGRYLAFPAVCLFPLSLAVIRGQAYYCYCDLLLAAEWVGRNHLYLTIFLWEIRKFLIIS